MGSGKNVTLDLSELDYLDARFLGLLIMLRKQLQSRGLRLRLVGAKGLVARIFRWNGLQFLLSSTPSGFVRSAGEGLLPSKSVAHD